MLTVDGELSASIISGGTEIRQKYKHYRKHIHVVHEFKMIRHYIVIYEFANVIFILDLCT